MIDRLTTISSHALAEERGPVGANDKIGSSARVLVRNPGGYGRQPGTFKRLRALSAYATHGVTLDGCSFERTTTGKLRPPTTRAVVRRAGAYAVTLPPSSASPLTLAGEAEAVAVAQRGPRVRRRSAGAALIVAVFVLTAIWAATARAAPTTVTVSSTPVTRPRSDDFVGLGFTYSALAQWMSTSGPVDPVLVGLIRNLTPSGRPSLRIGGESADRSWWPITGYARPLGITYNLGPALAEMAHRLAQTTNAHLLLGLELQADRPQLDKSEARELLSRIGRRYIQSLQIGNEPKLYTSIPWYKLVDAHPVVWYSPVGTPVYARPRSFGPSQFIAEVQQILRVIPKYAIAGPETNIPAWMQAFTRFLKPAGRVTTLTSHDYGVDNCVKDPQSDQYPTVPNLLSLRASRDLLEGLGPDISLVHQRGGSYRIDEMGAVTCTGRPGVSNTMATGLWAVDALFDAARQGVDGVNLHTDYARINNLFSLQQTGGQWQATVQPLYYGALLFAQADPAGSRLLDVQGGTSATLRAWASRGRDQRVRITLINDSLKGPATVRLQLPAGVQSANGTIERLQAPGGARATRGVTLGGRSFQTTTSGSLPAPQLVPVRARGGTLTVQLPKGSATLLTLGGGQMPQQ